MGRFIIRYFTPKGGVHEKATSVPSLCPRRMQGPEHLSSLSQRVRKLAAFTNLRRGREKGEILISYVYSIVYRGPIIWAQISDYSFQFPRVFTPRILQGSLWSSRRLCGYRYDKGPEIIASAMCLPCPRVRPLVNLTSLAYFFKNLGGYPVPHGQQGDHIKSYSEAQIF